jgi:hypothetical protein
VVHILPCEPEKLKQLEEMAAELGAHVYACKPPQRALHGKTYIQIGTNTTSQAFVVCQRLDEDVISDTWLRECYAAESQNARAKPPRLRPAYMLNTSTSLQLFFDNTFDMFGDSYARRFEDQEELDKLLDNENAWDEMSQHSDGNLSENDMRAIESDLLEYEDEDTGDDPAGAQRFDWSVFSGVIALLLPLNQRDKPSLALAEARLRAGGAVIATSDSSDLADRITHIVVTGTQELEQEDLRYALPVATAGTRRRRRGNPVKWEVVSTAWVEALRNGTDLPEPLMTKPEWWDEDD